MMPADTKIDLVLNAIRLAEYAHRNRPQGPHFRKAPPGQDRPCYFVHPAEVAWLLADAGCSHEVVAAGYLHDVIEDCGYTTEQLADEIDNTYVAELVEWVSRPNATAPDRLKPAWEIRNSNYLERIKRAPIDALNLSCADKTANLREMCHWSKKGYLVDEFTSRDHSTQLVKFIALNEVFHDKVIPQIYTRFQNTLASFQGLGQ
ncbi:HD domain-containing protein [Desulfosediminicola sp.]|uniref:HD domain-containing protein n=1 Tax=Desulfosediminicola sp. TaxID=2886825 RepID=UPI003AF30FD0